MQQVEERIQLGYSTNLKLIGAFAAIYLVWGSTYLAMRYAVESIPPLLMIGMRSAGAGALLYGWVRLKNNEQLQWQHWRSAAVGGFCFFALCHGSVAWAEQHVSSGIASVILALIPMWVVLLDWVRPGGSRPGRAVMLGIAIGFAGLLILVGPGVLTSGASTNGFATSVLALAALAWAVGTVYSRYAALDVSPAAISAMQLLTGGGMLLLGGTFAGEWPALLTHTVQLRSVLAVAYLLVVGSLLTFSAYIWLLRVSSPARVATYAYVNPVIAVFIGWAFAGEQLTVHMGIAAVMIVFAVAIIITFQHRKA